MPRSFLWQVCTTHRLRSPIARRRIEAQTLRTDRNAQVTSKRALTVAISIASLIGLSSCSDKAGNVPDSSTNANATESSATGATNDASVGATQANATTDVTTDATTDATNGATQANGNGTERDAETTPISQADTAMPATILPATTPPTTIAHGDGVAHNFADGSPVKESVLSTAGSIYSAAIIHDYDRLRDIIGDRRFRWGFLGERGPTKAWKEQFDAGGPDELARIAKLLELPPGKDSRGGTVWPAVALKDPAEWTLEDEAVLARLGFNPEDIDQTRTKGRYVDYKLVIDAEGIWTVFGVGY